ncbi:MAG: hypothetical protein KIT24_09055 [Phycisphaeraceae bacterium]|nr:hypothetical protein [Phycisphaeraceae bacterium]
MRSVTNTASCCAIVALALVAGKAAAQVDAFWTNPLGGIWGDGANWSTNPDFPNNNGTTYNAFLQSVGPSPYTVTLDQPITVRDLTLTSQRPTLDLHAETLRVRNWTQNTGATLEGTIGSMVLASGTTRLSSGAVMRGVDHFGAEGLFALQGPGIVAIIDDTCIGHSGANATWSGNGTIEFSNNGMFSFSANSTFRMTGNGTAVWDGLGTQAFIVNNGVMLKAAGAGVTDFDGIRLFGSGTVRSESGTMRFNALNYAGVLPNTWEAVNSSVIDLFNQDINTITGRVLLDGAGADLARSSTSQSALADLHTIAPAATLDLRGGKALTTSPLTDLTMDGELVIADASSLTLPAGRTLTNLVGGTLSGGRYAIAGTLNLNDDITTLDADLRLDGSGADVVNQVSTSSAVAGLHTITTDGVFTLAGGRSFTVETGVNFDVQGDGRVTIESGSEFFVPGGATLANLVGGVITQGVFDVRNGGTLRVFDGAVGTIDADVSLTGAGSNIIDQNDLDLFAGLSLIDSAGTLSLRDGRDLTTAGDLESRGNINLGSVSQGQAGATLTVNGNFTQTSGVLTLDGGTLAATGEIILGGELRGNGAINGDTVVNGIIDPGQSPGMLSIFGDLVLTLSNPDDQVGLVLEIASRRPGGYDQIHISGDLRFVDHTNPDGEPDFVGDLDIRFLPGFTPRVGETYTLLTFGGIGGDGFAQTLVSSLPNDLVAHVVWHGDRLEVIVTPAPGVFGLFGAAWLLAGRTRRR